MSGYGNSHYFSNYSKFAELLDPKLVIIINRSNDLRNNFCNSNTQNCSQIDKLCEINSEDNLRKNMKFLKVDGENYRFTYTKKKKKNDIKVKILRNFIDRFQSYYSLRHIYTMYLKRNKTIENDIVTKKIKKNKSDCRKTVDNYYVKKYYNEINNLIYQKIVITDKRKLLFVNVVPHKNLAGAEALFLTKTFNESSLPYMNFIQYDKLRFIMAFMFRFHKFISSLVFFQPSPENLKWSVGYPLRKCLYWGFHQFMLDLQWIGVKSKVG